jgi:hypothetical protein
MWPLAASRKSPKTGTVIATGHQRADLLRGGGFLAGSTITGESRVGRGTVEPVGEQSGEQGEGGNNLIQVGADRRADWRGGAQAERREDGAMVTASRPSTAASAVLMNAANSLGTRSWD